MNDDDLALLLDYFSSGAAREDMEAIMNDQNQALKHYEVIVSPPGSERVVYQIYAASVLDAKSEASVLYYGHCFTAQFKYIRVKRIKEEDEEWSDQDSRFITPALDLSAHNEQVLDTAYGPKETR